MCIVSFAWKAHPRWKLIAIGNRDEMHARPAEALGRWEKPAHMLAGRDTLAGGTWLGLSEQGRFAVITNLSGYGTPDANRVSRGDLLKDFLSGEGRYPDLSCSQFADFNPFNLITVARDDAFIHSNRPESASNVLAPGIHGLSNGPLNGPWPKSAHLNAALVEWIEREDRDPADLLDTLLDETTFQPKTLTNIGNEIPLEPRGSAIFIRNPVYGTRCSTVVAVDNHGQGTAIERRFDHTGESTGETVISFAWPT